VVSQLAREAEAQRDAARYAASPVLVVSMKREADAR
jgi:hypothetical protein